MSVYLVFMKNNFTYHTGAIKTRSWFETALYYKPRILSSKIEEFPCLVHTLSGFLFIWTIIRPILCLFKQCAVIVYSGLHNSWNSCVLAFIGLSMLCCSDGGCVQCAEASDVKLFWRFFSTSISLQFKLDLKLLYVIPT